MLNRITIRQTGIDDLDHLAPLFDAYRVFYGRDSDIEAARTFLAQRQERNESIVFLAFKDEIPVGFTQLYPAFSSVSLARSYLLNDLFVMENARRIGVAKALIEAAKNHAANTGAIRLTLSTAIDNLSAQATYDATGWRKDNQFLVYHLSVA